MRNATFLFIVHLCVFIIARQTLHLSQMEQLTLEPSSGDSKDRFSSLKRKGSLKRRDSLKSRQRSGIEAR